MLKKYIGDKSFYRRVLTLSVPIMIQSGITNFVSMLDNVMVGRVGTIEMTSVAIANQLIFVFNLCVFGLVSGAGIFGAQYVGKGNHEGVRHTFRFKLISSAAVAVIGIAVFLCFGDSLIGLYLRGDDSVADTSVALEFARSYLRIILIGLVPYAISQVYASTLRETDNSIPPMVAGTAAVFVNLFLNYVLIFGHFGAPEMGVRGAAVATVVSRYVEIIIIAVWAYAIREKIPFIKGAFRSLYVPKKLIGEIFLKGMPLMLNESLWSAGMAALTQCFSTRGIACVSAANIESTFWNVFSVVFLSLGAAIGIIIGQILGSSDFVKAKDHARKLIAFSVLIGIVSGLVFCFAAVFIPRFYNTTDEVRYLATRMMQITALLMPFEAFVNASYFTLRSGGKVIVTILFDSVFMWGVVWSTAFCLSRFTDMTILPLFATVQCLTVLKCLLGYAFVKKGIWLKSIV